MSYDDFIHLLPAYLAGDLSERERVRFERFAADHTEAREYLSDARRELERAVDMKHREPSRKIVERALSAARDEIKSGATEAVSGSLLLLHGLQPAFRFASAAAIIVAVAIGWSMTGADSSLGTKTWQGPQGQELSAELESGDMVRTGANGSYLLHLGDNLNMHVGPYTEMRLVSDDAQALRVELHRGNVLVDAAAGERPVNVVAGEKTSRIDPSVQSTMVAFEYSAPVRRLVRHGDVVDVDYERVRFADVVALGAEFGVTVQATDRRAEQSIAQYFTDIHAEQLDRDGYLRMVEQRAYGMGLGLSTVCENSYVLCSAGVSGNVATDLQDASFLNVVVMTGSANLEGTVISAVSPDQARHVSLTYADGARHPVEVISTDQSKMKQTLRNIILNTDVRFGDPESSPLLTQLQCVVSGNEKPILRRLYAIDAAIADTQKGELWIRADDDMKVYTVGNVCRFGETEGRLVWANERGAILESTSGETVHISFQ